MPPDLPRSPRQHRRRSHDADSATFAALIGMCFVGFLFLGLVMIVLPFRGLAFVLFGTIGFFAAHYLLWGRWLIRMRKRENDDQRDRIE